MNINGKQWNFRCNVELGMIDIHGESTSVQKLCNVINTQDINKRSCEPKISMAMPHLCPSRQFG